MYEKELKHLEKKLKYYNKIGKFRNKRIYLFGAGDNTRQIVKMLRVLSYGPVGIIDNDPSKHNSFCAGIKVSYLKEIPISSDMIILVYSFYWNEMKRQLVEYGVDRSQILILIGKEHGVYRYLCSALKGKIIYKKLKKEYNDASIFLCPYTGTGDIYLIGTFWDEYVTTNNINNYVFCVISKACLKVAKLFDIKNVVLLKKQDECSYLIDYYNLCPGEGKIKVLNDAWAPINDNLTEWFRGYKGLDFTKLFKKFVFNLPGESVPHHPILKNEKDRISKIFSENELIPDKTVVLSPYSNTLADLPLSFWAELTELLMREGYCVITNSSGKNEPPIRGTKGVFFSLDIAPQFVEYAGFFIGIRSGFCDIISSANAKKIILYDMGNRFYMSSAFDYFSLKTMQLSEDAKEYEFDHSNVSAVLNKILDFMGGGKW